MWNFSHDGNVLPDTIPDLAAAMAHDARLKVFSANGYHDLVTPFYTTELDLARLGADPNIGVHFYQGGHMTYLDDVARPLEKADLAAFYQAALAGAKAIPGAQAAASAPIETPARVPTATMPPAVMETPLRGPWLPERLRTTAPAPPTQGAALRAQVQRKLREAFDAARGKRAGELTREEAQAAGLGYIARDFDAIDVRRAGAVRFEDVERYLRERGASLPD